jgi:hypothetical protein
MKNREALKRADEILRAFVESQDIPPGGTKGTAAEHGEKTGEFLVALHRALHEYFRKVDDR